MPCDPEAADSAGKAVGRHRFFDKLGLTNGERENSDPPQFDKGAETEAI